MFFKIIKVILFSFLLISCGGGNEGSNSNKVFDIEELKIKRSILIYGNNEIYQRSVFYDSLTKNISNPLIIWIHGGGWIYGSPEGDDTLLYNKRNLLKGYPVLSVGYRLGEEGIFPNAENDVKYVLDFILGKTDCLLCKDEKWNKIKEYAKNGIILSGGSAGAHIALYLSFFYKDENKILCTHSVAGVINLIDLDNYIDYTEQLIMNHFTSEEKRVEADIIRLSLNNIISFPVIITASRKDKLVPFETVLPLRGANNFIINIVEGLEDGGHGITIEQIDYYTSKNLEYCKKGPIGPFNF